MTKTVHGPEGLTVQFPDDTDDATINRVMTEAYQHHKATSGIQNQPQPNLDMTPTEKSGTGVNEFVKGLDRLPNLVGLGNVSTGFTKADVSPGEAAARLGQGAFDAEAALGSGVMSTVPHAKEAAVAAVGGLTGRGAQGEGGFAKRYAEAGQDSKQLAEDHPLSNFVGQAYGFGRGGMAVKNVVKATTGKTLGIAGEAAALTGLQSIAQDPTKPAQAVEDAALAAVFGKVLQGVGDRVIKPVAQYVGPRIERAFASKAARAGEEFQIPEAQVQRIANRLKQPVEEVRKGLDDYVKANGVDANILAVVGDDTAAKFGELSRAKKGAADVFRKGEEEALVARPDRVANAVARTGETQTATEAADALAARGDNAVSRTTQVADDLAAEAKAKTTAAQRAVDDSAEAQSRAVSDAATAQTRQVAGQGDKTVRMVRDQTDALKAEQKAKIDASAAKLSQTIQERTAGIKSDEQVAADLKRHTDLVFRGGVDEAGQPVRGLAERQVTLPKGWLNKNFPEDPKTVAAVLRAKALTLEAGATRNRLLKAVDSMTGGADEGGEEAAKKGWETLKLTLDDVDNLRRALKKPVRVDGVDYNLSQIGNRLRDFAAAKHPEYKTEYLDMFANTMKALNARGEGAKVLGANSAAAVKNVATRVAGDETALGRMSTRQGAEDAALQAIAGSTKDGAQTLKTANSILRNAEAIKQLAGKEGADLVQVVRSTMANVQRIQREIADIAEAARTTREGVRDSVKAQTQRIADDATSTQRRISDKRDEVKRGLTDKQVERLKKLDRAAKAQIDTIKLSVAKNQRAISAASKVLSTTEGEFAAATAGSTENLGAVARGSIAGKAAQSPADAVSVVNDLTTPSVQRRVATVAGQDTADTLAAVGRTQKREIQNLDVAAARNKDTGPISEEVGLGMEAVASMMGRAGPGFVTSIIRRAAGQLQSLGISNKAAKAIAEAMLRQNRPYVDKLLNRLAKTERQRKVMAEALHAWAVGVSSSTIANAR